MLLDVFTCRPAPRSFISSGKAPNYTSMTTSLFDFSSSSWLIHRAISRVLDSSFFFPEVHLIHSRNFSNQATARRKVIQLENRGRRPFNGAVRTTVVRYTSFFISSLSIATCSYLRSGHWSSGLQRKDGLFSQRSFFRNSFTSRPRLSSSAGFNLPGQCLHCSGTVRSLI